MVEIETPVPAAATAISSPLVPAPAVSGIDVVLLNDDFSVWLPRRAFLFFFLLCWMLKYLGTFDSASNSSRRKSGDILGRGHSYRHNHMVYAETSLSEAAPTMDSALLADGPGPTRYTRDENPASTAVICDRHPCCSVVSFEVYTPRRKRGRFSLDRLDTQ